MKVAVPTCHRQPFGARHKTFTLKFLSVPGYRASKDSRSCCLWTPIGMDDKRNVRYFESSSAAFGVGVRVGDSIGGADTGLIQFINELSVSVIGIMYQ